MEPFIAALVFVVLVGLTKFIRNRKKGKIAKQMKPAGKFEIVSSNGPAIQYKCGHEGPQQFVLSVFGEHSKLIEDSDKCPECLIEISEKVIARCTACGLAIWPGDGTALYNLALNKKQLPYADEAVRVGGSVMGCLRWDCCPSGAFFAGHWTQSGFRSAFGGKTAAEHVMETGEMVVVNIPE